MQLSKKLDFASKVIKAPEHIAIDITNRCNMKCLHCFNRSENDENGLLRNELTNQEIKNFIADVAALAPPSFCICGGEPLLKYDMIKYALENINNQITSISLVTNGFLMNMERAQELASLGINTIQISLDGANFQTHEKLRGVKGAFQHAVNAINYCLKAQIRRVAVAFSPTKFNIDQFGKYVDFLYDLGIRSIRVQPLMLLGNALNNRDIFPSERDYFKLYTQITEARAKYPNVKIEWGDPVDHLMRFSTVLSKFVPFINIRSDGYISITPYWSFSVGNIKKHSLQEYWDHGLAEIWSLSIMREIAGNIYSSADFYREDLPLPTVFHDDFVEFDIIDDNLLALKKSDLYKLYWQKVSAFSL